MQSNKCTVTHCFTMWSQHLRVIGERKHVRIMFGTATINKDPYIDVNLLSGTFEVVPSSINPNFIAIIGDEETIEWDVNDSGAATPTSSLADESSVMQEQVVSLDD